MKTIVVVAMSATLLASGIAAAQSQKEKCLRSAQVKLAACQQKLPPNVTPKDPKKPTDSEKAAMLKYTEAWKKCNTEGSNAALACK